MVLGWGGTVVVMHSLLSLPDRIYRWFTWHRALPRGATLTEKMTMITAQRDVTKWNSAELEPITAKRSTRACFTGLARGGKKEHGSELWLMISLLSVTTARVPNDSTNMGSLKEYRSINNFLYLCNVYLGYQCFNSEQVLLKNDFIRKCVWMLVCVQSCIHHTK